ncbi:hypothetical protein LCGC14_2772500, partial [marine sediment metagenome]
MKKIIVYTHNPVRDSITDDCLVDALRKEGHMVWKRIYLDRDKDAAVIIKPDLVIMSEIRCEYSVDFAKQCKQWGIQVVVRPCEVGISAESIPGIKEDYRRAIFGENWPANNCIDLMLCWGPKMKDLFAEYGGMDSEKMAAVGGIAFDPFFLPPPPQDVKRTEKKRVLFATGFAYADRNPQYSVPEARPEDEVHRVMVETDLKARSEWFKVIKRFWSEHGNDWEIYVKVHPGERLAVYAAVLKDTVVFCPPKVPSVASLQHFDIVVHAGSTMAYEAHLAKKPAINLLNVCQDVIISKISPNVTTFEELVEALKTTPFGQSNANETIIETLERDYYGTADGKASERAAKEVSKLPGNKTAIPAEWPRNTEMKYMTPCILKDVEVWYCKGCGTSY